MHYHLLFILALIATSAFFSAAEISLAASRRLRLRQLADDGNARAAGVPYAPKSSREITLPWV